MSYTLPTYTWFSPYSREHMPYPQFSVTVNAATTIALDNPVSAMTSWDQHSHWYKQRGQVRVSLSNS